jgi:hypothetical protein
MFGCVSESVESVNNAAELKNADQFPVCVASHFH